MNRHTTRYQYLSRQFSLLSLIFLSCLCCIDNIEAAEAKSTVQMSNKKLVYLVSDLRIPFWDIMWRGIK
ncbi:MAG: hypothetical protein AB2689_07865, partial [Candidatus Thiodiazotropha taylori]|nr:hypothetical protein [Candidatus Thiodiazotropha taylori]